MKIELEAPARDSIFADIEQFLGDHALTITARDSQRPWGGFFVVDEKESTRFINLFFPDEVADILATRGKLSPKLLLVAPGKRLSWQYHFRRAEIWRVLRGTVAVATSLTDTETTSITLSQGQEVRLAQGERHRLIGLDDWAVLAEIWQHTDPENPSDENDIVRVQDDFGR